MPTADRGRTAVVIPTRNRPARLELCLAALAEAHAEYPFTAWVCDSSSSEQRADVERACARYPWVELRFHAGRNIAAARNFCVAVADAELLVSVDDDVIVEPQAVKALVEAYDRAVGPRVVAGAVRWGSELTLKPMVLRAIGYGRPARSDETPAFINSSLFLYPRAFGRQWPWNERIRRASDVLMGAIWVRAGISLLWAPEARAFHDGRDVVTLEQHDDHVYAVLAHVLVARVRPLRLALLETLGLAAGVKAYGRTPRGLLRFARVWVRGHRAFARDFRWLRQLVQRPVPPG